MLLTELELSGMLDGYNTLVARNKAGENVEQCRLAAARAARDDDIEPHLHAGPQEINQGRGECAQPDEVLGLEGGPGELADSDYRADQRDRRGGGGHARAGGGGGVDLGRGVIPAAPRRRGDAVHGPPHTRTATGL